jgi:hypothetical protein
MTNHPNRTYAGTLPRVGAPLLSALLHFALLHFALLLFALLISPLTRAESANALDHAFLALLNDERVAAGQHRLIPAPGLQAMARDWSAQQVNANRLSHRPVEHQKAWIEDDFTPYFSHVAENVGVGSSVLSLHRTFMQSEKHRHNALGDFTHVGVGTVQDTSGRIWVTFNFVDAPEPAPTALEGLHRHEAPGLLSTRLPSSSEPARSAIARGEQRVRRTP